MKLKFLKLAQLCSKKSKSHPKVGCVIVKKNKIVGLGWNDRSKTHPKSQTMGNFRHAELHALIDASDSDLKGSHVYVFREHANGMYAMVKPCVHCHAILADAGVKKVFYTTYGGWDEYEIENT